MLLHLPSEIVVVVLGICMAVTVIVTIVVIPILPIERM
jgi:hypothetical protein